MRPKHIRDMIGKNNNYLSGDMNNVVSFVSRAGEKLRFALEYFDISVKGLICADFGSSTGGFVDCLLQNGAIKVYAVETGYGVLDWKLRNDPRVIVMERTNAMHVNLPEKMDFISVDTSWTKQEKILPNVVANLKPSGVIVSLIKPHYESGKARLEDDEVEETLQAVQKNIEDLEIVKIVKIVESPILGEKGKNREFLMLITVE